MHGVLLVKCSHPRDTCTQMYIHIVGLEIVSEWMAHTVNQGRESDQ